MKFGKKSAIARSSRCLAVALLTTVVFGANLEPVSKSQPNVLFIICDDLNDSVVGFGGHPRTSTPNLDRFSELSVRFLNAHSNAPVCGPSRASFLTGVYPHVSGYYGYNQQKNRWDENPVLSRAVTLFAHFSNHGYNVYGTGKLFHHHSPYVLAREDGFDGHSGIRRDMGPFAFNGKRRVAHPNAPEASKDEGYVGSYVSFAPLSAVPRFAPDTDQGIPGHAGWMNSNGSPFRYRNEEDRDPMADEQYAEWVAELLQATHDKPFMIALGFVKPHSPWYAPEAFFDLHPSETLELPPYLSDDRDDTARILARTTEKGIRFAHDRFTHLRETLPDDDAFTHEWKRWLQAYLACVSFVDAQIGKVLRALERSPYADNTIVVITGDHGFHMGEKDLLHKRTVWEESTRVPLFIHVPDFSADGKSCVHPVSLVDLYPTFADLCGLPMNPNEDREFEIGGHSLRSLIQDPESGKWKGPSVALSAVPGLVDPGLDRPGRPENQHFTVRSERYRYVLCSNGEEELYDHFVDPNEWHNLAQKRYCHEVKSQLRDAMESLVTGDGFQEDMDQND